MNEKTFQLMSLQYELAMQMGTTLDLTELFRSFLETLIQRVGGRSAAVIDSGGHASYDVALSSGRVIVGLPADWSPRSAPGPRAESASPPEAWAPSPFRGNDVDSSHDTTYGGDGAALAPHRGVHESSRRARPPTHDAGTEPAAHLQQALSDGGVRHVFSLEGIGWLVLDAAAPGFDPLVPRALLPLMHRLALAARACNNHARVEATERRFRALVQTLPEVVLEARSSDSANLVFDYVSPRASDVLGLKPDALVSDPENLDRWMYESDAVLWRETLKDAILHHRSFECRVRAHVGEAGPRWFLLAGSPADAPESGASRWSMLIQDITARERLVALRQESLASQIDTLLASVGDAVVGSSEDGRITLWNHGAERLFGYPRERVLDRPLSMLVPERLKSLHQQGFERHLRTGETRVAGSPTELPGLHADGHEIPVELMLSAVSGGDDIRFIGVIRDLSPRHEATLERTRQLQLLTSIWEAVPDLMFIVGTDGCIQYLQKRSSPDLVVPQDQIVGRTIGELLPPDIASQLMAAVVTATTGGQVASVEYTLDLPHGPQTFEARLAPIDAMNVTALVRNITTERERQRLLVAERARLQTLLASTSAIVYSASLPDFAVDYVSDSATEVLGFPVSAFLEEGFWMRSLHPDDQERVLKGLEGLPERGRHSHEYRHRHANGTYRWLQDQVRVLHDASGKPTSVIGASFDITERKLAESRLARALELQRAVSELSTSIASVDAAGFEASLRTTLERVGQMCSARRVTLYRLRDGRATSTHAWAGVDVQDHAGGPEQFPLEDAAELAPLSAGRSVILHDVATAAGEQDAFRTLLRDRGVVSMVVTPMLRAARLRGLLCVENPTSDSPEELNDLIPPLRLVAEVIGDADRRTSDERALRELNAQISRKVEQQRGMLLLSGAMATSTANEDLYELLSGRLSTVLGSERVTLMTFDEGREHIRIRFLDGVTPASPSPDDNWVKPDLREATVPAHALRDHAVWPALSLGQVVSSRDCDDDFPDWRHLREAYGLSHFVVVPLMGPQGVFGCMNAAYSEVRPVTSGDIDWLRQVGSLLGAHLLAHEAHASVERMNRGLEERVISRTHQLRRSEERFLTLFREAPQGMVIVDETGRITQSNARASKLFKLEASELSGRGLLGLVPDIQHERIAPRPSRRGENDASDQSQSHEPLKALRADGTSFLAEIGIVEVPDDGTTSRIVGISDVSERVASQAALKRSLSEKETLLKEIHHRVKNNLQIISSLLMLQMERFPSETARAMMLEAVLRVRSMALIHQQLYGVDSLDRVDLSDYARTLSESLKSALMPSAQVEVTAAPVKVTVHHAVPLGLILNEFVTNAIKYGLRRDPDAIGRTGPDIDVLVELSLDGEELTMAVTDSGPGLPPPAELEAKASLGLDLVRALTRQLRGRLTFDEQAGTRAAITCMITDGTPLR